jgi:hypothetical protein
VLAQTLSVKPPKPVLGTNKHNGTKNVLRKITVEQRKRVRAPNSSALKRHVGLKSKGVSEHIVKKRRVESVPPVRTAQVV